MQDKATLEHLPSHEHKITKQIRFKNIKFTLFNSTEMQMAQGSWNERQITESCTFSTVAKVFRLYLLCPCQPLLHRDCFDKRAKHGFMCLLQSYSQCEHCQPGKDAKEA